MQCIPIIKKGAGKLASYFWHAVKMNSYTLDYTLKYHMHARPCSILHQLISKYRNNYDGIMLYMKKGDEEVDAYSVLNSLMLGAAKGEQVIFKIEGNHPKRDLESILHGIIEEFEILSNDVKGP
jgi:phosphotransferase system HPr (HPr) family protein